jgi:hypothetical protein
LGGGKVHHYDPLRLGCGLTSLWLERQGCNRRLLVGELVSSLHHLLLDVGLPSMGMSSLPLLRSASSLEGVVGGQPRCQHPWLNHLHILDGRSVLLPQWGCDGSRRSLLREGRPEPPPPFEAVWNSSVESSIMACRGDGGPLWVKPMKVVPKSLHLGERLRPLK